MNFMDAVKSAYRNYVNFNGRAARSELWWFTLFTILVSIVIGVVESSLGMGRGMMEMGNGGFSASFAGGPLSAIWSLANLLPSLAVGARRLHDVDRSGWWMLIIFIPILGALLLLYWYVTKGTSGDNRFGADRLA